MINTGQPEENFEEILEEYIPSDMNAVIREKNAGESSLKFSPRSEIKQYPAPQDELDLHNHTGEEAKRALYFFINNSHRNGLKAVRIITGKGAHSDEGKSVLRGVAEEKIIQLKRQGIVLDYRWEQGKREKSGSIIVYIK